MPVVPEADSQCSDQEGGKLMKELFKFIVSVSIGFVVGLALIETVLPTWAGSIAAGAVTCMVSVWLSDKGW